jgi:hypothetical protein
MNAAVRLVSRYGGCLSLLLTLAVLVLFALTIQPFDPDVVLIFSVARPYLLIAAILLSLATLAVFVAGRPWRNPPSDTSIFQAFFAVLAFAAWCFALAYARPF